MNVRSGENIDNGSGRVKTLDFIALTSVDFVTAYLGFCERPQSLEKRCRNRGSQSAVALMTCNRHGRDDG